MTRGGRCTPTSFFFIAEYRKKPRAYSRFRSETLTAEVAGNAEELLKFC